MRTTIQIRLYVALLMLRLFSEAARSAVGRPDLVWSEHLGLGSSCVKEPTQQERAHDYGHGEQAT